MRSFSVQQARKRALIRATANESRGIAIFVHGFNGSFLKTWGELPELLYRHADSDPVFAEWDFLFIGYTTLGPAGIGHFSHISGLIHTEMRAATSGHLAGRVDKPYQRVALLGHSLGTLGIRELVASVTQCPAPTFRTIHSIGFFGSPLNGSLLAHLGQWVAPIGGALRPGSPEMIQLQRHVSAGWQARQWPQVNLVLGTEDMVVGPNLYNWAGDLQPPDYHAVDHSLICKPIDFADGPIDFLRRVLR